MASYSQAATASAATITTLTIRQFENPNCLHSTPTEGDD